jgi:hypothetical protein
MLAGMADAIAPAVMNLRKLRRSVPMETSGGDVSTGATIFAAWLRAPDKIVAISQRDQMPESESDLAWPRRNATPRDALALDSRPHHRARRFRAGNHSRRHGK